MIIYKHPEFQDDSYYFVIQEDDKIIPIDDMYYNVKRNMFKNMMISKDEVESFKGRPSFTGLENQPHILGTIYTASAQIKNKMMLNDIINEVKHNKDVSRRCVVVIADTLKDYLDDTVNTSCLNIIHYFKDSVKLFFRASDIENELLYDINLVKEFFINPVYSKQPEIHIIASTAQNVNHFKTTNFIK